MSASSGNSGHSLVWYVALPSGTYYWAVQAIDAAYIGSAFSEELSFTIAGGSERHQCSRLYTTLSHWQKTVQMLP